MIIYNFESVPGLALGYNNMITYNHKAESGQELNLPLGLTLSRTWALKNGDGLDLGLGYYEVIERPRDAPDSQIKFSIIYLFN